MEKDTEVECTCGHSSDGRCHCCECESEHREHVYAAVDEDELLNQLNDWD